MDSSRAGSPHSPRERADSASPMQSRVATGADAGLTTGSFINYIGVEEVTSFSRSRSLSLSLPHSLTLTVTLTLSFPNYHTHSLIP